MEIYNIDDFLIEGMIIKTRHAESQSWISNLVYTVESDSIEIDIGCEKNYIESVIMIGDTMKCKYTDDNYEYSFTGWIAKIKADFPQSITLKITKMDMFDNRRMSKRFDIYLCSVIKLFNNDATNSAFSIMTNISNSGAGFILHEDIEKIMGLEDSDLNNTKFIFDVYISPERELEFEGIIRRKKLSEKGIEYGVVITNITNENEKILNEFLKELENKDKEFYNRRYDFWNENNKNGK